MPLDELPLDDGNASTIDYWETGYRVLPLVHNTKRPAFKGKGAVQQYIRLSPQHTPEDYLHHIFTRNTRYNVGVIIPDRVVVVDVDSDDPEKVELLQKHCGVSPMVSVTPSGGQHHWYGLRAGTKVQKKVQIKGMPFDLPVGYSVESPSEINGVPYRWQTPIIAPHKLPKIRIAWLRERTPRRTKKETILTPDDADIGRQRLLARARAYAACVEGAIEGQGGSNRTYRLVNNLVHDFHLTYDETLAVMLEWNEVCEPPWTVKDIRHKIDDALKKGRSPSR